MQQNYLQEMRKIPRKSQFPSSIYIDDMCMFAAMMMCGPRPSCVGIW